VFVASSALVLGRATRGLLFGITELDSATYVVALIAPFLAAVLGCYLPGWAAMRIEPLIAPRQEETRGRSARAVLV
jgi:hypothetical protein